MSATAVPTGFVTGCVAVATWIDMSNVRDWELSLAVFRVEKEGTLSAEEVRALKALSEERRTPINCRTFLAVLSSHQRLLEQK